MPIKHSIWTVGEKPAPLVLGRLASEQQPRGDDRRLMVLRQIGPVK